MSALAAARRLAPPRLLAALVPGPRLGRRLAVLAVITALLAGVYLLWLRDSDLVRVQEVTVTGLTGEHSGRVRSALEGAARGMSTLHLDRDRLERVGSSYPAVQAIEVRPDFPSGVRIHVIEHVPAAVLVAGDRRTPVAADGSLLAGLQVEDPLPEVDVSSRLPAKRLPPGDALDAVRVAGAAPAVLVARIEEISRERQDGLVVRLAEGPELLFGDVSRMQAKWAAATRVLADEDAAGAEYVDVRIPERPAAGGLAVETVAPVAPAGSVLEPAGPVAPVGEGAGVSGSPPAAPPPAAGDEPAAQAPATGTPTADEAAGGPPAVPQP